MKRAKPARFRHQRFALDLFFQVELDVGPQRGCPVVGVPDYRQAAVPEHGVEIEVGSQLMRQERIHASVDRAPAQEVDAGLASVSAPMTRSG